MKILWLSHLVPYPPKGGVLQRSYNLLRETAVRHDVHLLAFVQRDLVRRSFGDVTTGCEQAHRALARLCKEVRFFDIPCETKNRGKQALALKSLVSPLPYTIAWLRSESVVRALRDTLARTRFDVVHFDTISLAPYLCLLDGESAVLDHHNIESHMLLRRASQEPNWLRKLYFWQEGLKLQRYERRVCADFDMNITCSSLDSDRLAEVCRGVAVEEIPNGVDTDYFSPHAGKQVEGRLVFAGGLRWYPNRQAMLFFAKRVWPELRRRIPSVTMDVIGADPPAELLEIARADPAFRVHGYVPDVRPYLDQAAVYVCPISDGGGTKLKMLDAFAMAKATVANPVACEGIDAQPGRHVLHASAPAEYVESIALLLGDAALRRRIGDHARALVLERYRYDAIGEKLSGVYGAIARRRQPSGAVSEEGRESTTWPERA